MQSDGMDASSGMLWTAVLCYSAVLIQSFVADRGSVDGIHRGIRNRYRLPWWPGKLRLWLHRADLLVLSSPKAAHLSQSASRGCFSQRCTFPYALQMRLPISGSIQRLRPMLHSQLKNVSVCSCLGELG